MTIQHGRQERPFSPLGFQYERVFVDVKEKYSMRYTHHCGLSRVTSWVRLKFATINLKKLVL